MSKATDLVRLVVPVPFTASVMPEASPVHKAPQKGRLRLMSRRARIAWSAGLRLMVPIAMAGLEFAHPLHVDRDVSSVIAAAGGFWLPLHVVLLTGYLVLVWTLWQITRVRAARICLLVFSVVNSVFVGLDGLIGGILVMSHPDLVDRLWSSPIQFILSTVTGGAWSGALLLIAYEAAAATAAPLRIGIAGTWLAFLAGGVAAFLAEAVAPVATLACHGVALGTGAALVYQRGSRGVPIALLLLAAILPQHAGPAAALGLLCVVPILVARRLSGHSDQ